MPLELLTLPCLADNYAFLLHDPASGQTAVFDAPEAAPIEEALNVRGWNLSHIFLTHHHYDHIDGVEDLRAKFAPKVIGAAADAHRLPTLDEAVQEGDTVTFGPQSGAVIDVSGHTVGHIAFHFPESRLAFTGDSLMAFGCGRLFEGTPEQMFQSLGKLAQLPADTLICSGHEYTTSNGNFARTVDPENTALLKRCEDTLSARAAEAFTVPSLLSLELSTNPFLRAHEPSVKLAIGLPNASDVESFTKLRAMKDVF